MWRFERLMMTVCGVLTVAAPACADLVGFAVFREGPGGGGAPPPGPERWIYRVYAEFSSPSDKVGAWGFGGLLGSGQITNITFDGNSGSGFTNIPDDDSGNTAPQFPLLPTDWDTYMTIGVLYGYQGSNGVDGTNVAPGTPTFITDGSTIWTAPLGFVHLDEPRNPQGRADYRVAGNDTNMRTLIMQLVVNAGEHVEGTIGMIWRSETQGFVATGLTFTSVPSPGPAMLFMTAAALPGRRARRKH